MLCKPALALNKLLDASVKRCSSWNQENIRAHSMAALKRAFFGNDERKVGGTPN